MAQNFSKNDLEWKTVSSIKGNVKNVPLVISPVSDMVGLPDRYSGQEFPISSHYQKVLKKVTYCNNKRLGKVTATDKTYWYELVLFVCPALLHC